MLQARELRFDVKRLERRRKATTETKTLGDGKCSRDVRCNGGVCVFSSDYGRCVIYTSDYFDSFLLSLDAGRLCYG